MNGRGLWLLVALATALLVVGGVDRFYVKNFLLSLAILLVVSFLLAGGALVRGKALLEAKQPEAERRETEK